VDAAAKRIADAAPGADVGTVRLNLASLASIRQAAEELLPDRLTGVSYPV
jgi:hypothetical protein